MTEAEAKKFVKERTEVNYHSNPSFEHYYIDVLEVYKLLDLIFDEKIKDSFINVSDSIIEL
jgi:hypothetical protein